MQKAKMDVLGETHRKIREWVRKILYRKASRNVLVIGDSHVRVFENWRFLWAFPHTRFNVVYVPGSTAYGIANRASQTGAYTTFTAALEQQGHDMVLVNLGEVDTAYMLWRSAERSKKNINDLMLLAVKNYCVFLQDIQQKHPIVVLSACLPTLTDQADSQDDVARVRSSVKVSQQERTALALEFNARVAEFCAANAIPYLNCGPAALGVNGIVRDEWMNQEKPDHHYARPPYARWLAKALKQLKHPAGVTLR
jgi:hypothetical protein